MLGRRGSDEEARRRGRARDEIRRAARDVALQEAFAAEISRMFPGCPRERADAIAGHACTRRSGRVGRSTAGQALQPEAVRAAVLASVRHVDTSYDTLLMAGVPEPKLASVSPTRCTTSSTRGVPHRPPDVDDLSATRPVTRTVAEPAIEGRACLAFTTVVFG